MTEKETKRVAQIVNYLSTIIACISVIVASLITYSAIHLNTEYGIYCTIAEIVLMCLSVGMIVFGGYYSFQMLKGQILRVPKSREHMLLSLFIVVLAVLPAVATFIICI